MLKTNLIFLLIFLPVLAFAQNNEPTLKLDVPLFDLPYQIDAMNTVGHGFFSSYANPSMAQSLAITVDMYSGFHYGMKRFYDTSTMNNIWKNIIYYGGTALGDGLLMVLPFGGMAWMHEEHHRAILSRFEKNSFNTTYFFGNYVNQVSDESLERFKAESPVDFVRLHAAGAESELLLLSQLQRNNFFYRQDFFNEFSYLLICFSVWNYLWTVTAPFTDNPRLINETNIMERDFTGHDWTSWVYDLFLPDDPYSERGVHASGIGIDRYRKTSDLSPEMMNYAKKQVWWSLANIVSPVMLGFRSLPLGHTDIRWNFSSRHFLTSFGTDLSFNVFLNIDKYNFAVVYHSYQNYENYFPAIEIEMIDFPISIKYFCIYFSPRIILGIQPKDQSFFTSETEFFGLIGSRFDFQITGNWLPYIEVVAKTDGWVAGNEFLEKNISFRLGISARF